jgi:hypothetical protein
MLESGGTVEDGLSAVLEAARQEYGWTVVIHRPALMRIDGCEYRWPEGNGHA